MPSPTDGIMPLWRLMAVTHYGVYLSIAPDRIKAEKKPVKAAAASAIGPKSNLLPMMRPRDKSATSRRPLR